MVDDCFEWSLVMCVCLLLICCLFVAVLFVSFDLRFDCRFELFDVVLVVCCLYDYFVVVGLNNSVVVFWFVMCFLFVILVVCCAWDYFLCLLVVWVCAYGLLLLGCFVALCVVVWFWLLVYWLFRFVACVLLDLIGLIVCLYVGLLFCWLCLDCLGMLVYGIVRCFVLYIVVLSLLVVVII